MHKRRRLSHELTTDRTGQHYRTTFVSRSYAPIYFAASIAMNKLHVGFSKQIELPKGGCLFIDDEGREIPRAQVFDSLKHCFNPLVDIDYKKAPCTSQAREAEGPGFYPTKMGPRQRFRVDRAQQQLHWWHSFARSLADSGRSDHASAWRLCPRCTPRFPGHSRREIVN